MKNDFDWNEFFSQANSDNFNLPNVCVGKLLCTEQRSKAMKCISEQVK